MHVTTTPSVSYIVRSDDFDCGIMISASHNPFTDNGIKLLNSAGEKMEQSVIDEIEAYLDGDQEIPFATGRILAVRRTIPPAATAISAILSACPRTRTRA